MDVDRMHLGEVVEYLRDLDKLEQAAQKQQH